MEGGVRDERQDRKLCTPWEGRSSDHYFPALTEISK